RRGARWYVKRESRTLPFDELAAAQKDFKEPWTLRTSHYEITTNVALKDAVAVAIDLERYYRAAYGLLAKELVLYEVTEPMYVKVYADRESYPESTGGRIAYFDPQLNTAYVDAEQGVQRGVFLHEATHQLLYNTAEHAKAARGEVPGWLSEGLA